VPSILTCHQSTASSTTYSTTNTTIAFAPTVKYDGGFPPLPSSVATMDVQEMAQAIKRPLPDVGDDVLRTLSSRYENCGNKKARMYRSLSRDVNKLSSPKITRRITWIELIEISLATKGKYLHVSRLPSRSFL
jgi:hypothetical protein